MFFCVRKDRKSFKFIFFSQDFLGNTDSNSVKRNDFPIPVVASSVYFLPLTVNNNVGLRLELYGCKGGLYLVNI